MRRALQGMLFALFAFSLSPATGNAAARLDTIKAFAGLEPGRSYTAVSLDGNQQPTPESYTLHVSQAPGGVIRIDLDQEVPFDFGLLGHVPLPHHIGEVWAKPTSAGWQLIETRSGFGSLDQRENAAIPNPQPVFPRFLAPDHPIHRVVSLKNGSGAPYPNGGLEMELISLHLNWAQGLLVSWTFDAGPSCSLWADGHGNFAGIELDWTLYRALDPIIYPAGPGNVSGQ